MKINPLILFGEKLNEKNEKILYFSLDDDISDANLLYATLSLMSVTFKKILDIDLKDEEKVKNFMPFLEKMLLKFPKEFVIDVAQENLEKQRLQKEADDEEESIIKKIKDKIPPEMLELIEKRKNSQ